MPRPTYRSSCRLVVIIGLGLAVATAANAGDVPQPDLSQAEPQVREKILMARAQVETAPESDESWGRYALVLHAHGFPAAAETAYRRACELAPQEFQWSYTLAILLQESRPEETVVWLEKALKIKPDYAPAYVRLGMAHEAIGGSAAAWAHYGRAAELNPELGVARLRRGQLALQRDELDLARTELETAVQLLPRSGAALFSLARLYQLAGNNELARSTARKARNLPHIARFEDAYAGAVAAEAATTKSFVQRAAAHAEAGMLDEAISDVQKGLSYAPDDLALLSIQASLLGRQGDYEQGVEVARRVLAADPSVDSMHHVLALALFRLGRHDEADVEARLALAAGGDVGPANRVRAQILAMRGKADEAIGHLERALAINADDMISRRLLAGLLVKANRLEEAQVHLEHAVAAVPSHARVWIELASVRLRLGQAAEAIVAYERAQAAAKDPRMRSAATQGRAHALLSVGRVADAASALRDHNQRNPDDWQIAQDLAWILATADDAVVRDGEEAVRLAKLVTSSADGRSAGTLDTLAAAYAEAGRFDDAVTTMGQSIRLAEEAGYPAARIKPYRERLARYRSGEPYREEP